jgi:hypothetical protein
MWWFGGENRMICTYFAPLRSHFLVANKISKNKSVMLMPEFCVQMGYLLNG